MISFRQYLEKVDPEEMRARMDKIKAQRQGLKDKLDFADAEERSPAPPERLKGPKAPPRQMAHAGDSTEDLTPMPVPTAPELDAIPGQGKYSDELPTFSTDKAEREHEVLSWASTKAMAQINKAIDTMIDRASDSSLSPEERKEAREIAGQLAVILNRRKSSPSTSHTLRGMKRLDALERGEEE